MAWCVAAGCTRRAIGDGHIALEGDHQSLRIEARKCDIEDVILGVALRPMDSWAERHKGFDRLCFDGRAPCSTSGCLLACHLGCHSEAGDQRDRQGTGA